MEGEWVVKLVFGKGIVSARALSAGQCYLCTVIRSVLLVVRPAVRDPPYRAPPRTFRPNALVVAVVSGVDGASVGLLILFLFTSIKIIRWN